MNYHFLGHPHGAPSVVYLNHNTPATPIHQPVFAPTYSPPGHGPILTRGYPGVPLNHGPSTFDQAASHLGFSQAESRSLGHGAPLSRAERDWLAFSSQPWVHSGGLEPRDARGRSVLHEWLDHPGSQTYVCRVPKEGRPCGASLTRQDRALAHIRRHLDARPYECSGKCGNPACRDKFAAPAYLKAHINPVSKFCRFCGHEFLRQNVRRHEENCPMRRY